MRMVTYRVKDVFTVARVFELMRQGHLTQAQGIAILIEIERKPWWQRVFGI